MLGSAWGGGSAALGLVVGGWVLLWGSVAEPQGGTLGWQQLGLHPTELLHI